MKRSLTLAIVATNLIFAFGCGIPWSDEEPDLEPDEPTVELVDYVPASGPGVVTYDSLKDDDKLADSISMQLIAPDGDVEEMMVYGVVAAAGNGRAVAHDMRTSEPVPLSCLKVDPGYHEATDACPAFECIAIRESDCDAAHVRPTAHTPPVGNPAERGLRIAMAAHGEATRAHERIDGHHEPIPDAGDPAPRPRRRAAPAPEPQVQAASEQPDPPEGTAEEPPAQDPAPDADPGNEVEGS